MYGPFRPFVVVSLTAVLLCGCSKKRKEETPADASAPAAAHPVRPSARPDDGLREITATSAEGAAGEKAKGVQADLAKSDEVYEAWFRKYKLDLNDPKMLDEDPDGDGFSNRDEFMADTNPIDPKSHPPKIADAQAHTGLKLKEFNEVKIPIVLESVQGDTAKIKRLDAGDRIDTVKTGQTIPGLNLKVQKVQNRQITDKHGAAVDASRMTLEDAATQEKTVVVKDMPARSAATYAVLTSDDGKSSITVKQGDTFTWPQQGGVTYRVIDLRADQTVLQEEGTGRMWTVMK